MPEIPRIVIKPGKVQPFFGRHPWVLNSAVARIDGIAADGAEVDVVSHKGGWIARGLYNSRSRICTRLYSWQEGEPLDADFWRKRLIAAIELRKQIGYDRPDGAARLVYSEADGMSGLIVDRYADYFVVQVNALVMAERLGTIVPLLAELTSPRGILARAEGGTAKLEGLEFESGPRWGKPPDGPVFITENDVRFGVDLSEGQKTGYYLDQRENRIAAAKYLRDRRVLDMFCYSGNFSLAALKIGGARETLGIDGSEKAIAAARAGAELNHAHNARFEVGDAFETLDSHVANGEKYGGVILDPPKFTRSRKNLNSALRAYHRINRMAVELLEPGGILVTCSCSGAVTREDFLFMLAGVAQQSGRDIQVLEQRGASPDHPVSTTCLETEYLKCFICRVI